MKSKISCLLFFCLFIFLFVTQALADRGIRVKLRESERVDARIAEEVTLYRATYAFVNGIVRDTNTGLEWKVGPDKPTTWDQAKQWVQSLNTGGGVWRMPTIDELEGLYKRGVGDRNMRLPLKTTGWGGWSGETRGSSVARAFYFSIGLKAWLYRGTFAKIRGFAVRSRSDG